MAKISGIIRSFIGLGVLALCPLFTAPAHADCTPPPAGLVSWWPGEGNANDIAGGNNGTLQGGITFAPGEVGQAFSFNASTSSSVRIPYAPSLVTPAYTVETWINPTAQVSGGIGQTLIFGQPYGQAQLLVRTGTTGVLVAFQFGINQFTFYDVQSTNEIPIGQFTHIAGTWDGTTLRLYINGVLNAQNTPGATPVDTGCDFFIGGFNTPEAGSCQYVGQFFQGLIDEVSFYNRALSADEIATIYAASSAGKCAPPCTPAPAGIVAWWPAEGNANDIIGTNNGTAPNGVGYAAGVVGQAFSFNGTNSYVQVPDAPALHLTNQLTIEFWVKRQQIAGRPYGDIIVEKGGDWTGGVENYGVGIAPVAYGNLLQFFFADGNRGGGIINDLNWHHCAVVARNGDTDPTFYIDGVQQPVTERQGAATINLYPSTAPLHIGAEISQNYVYYSDTLVDELSFYNRELSSNEIASIYDAGANGKCPPAPMPPAISSQPINQTVTVGQTATFSVSASGTAPLSYQWQFGGTNLLAATNSLLTLTNVQLSQAGNYSVQISNTLGSTNSATAVLNVVAAPTCTPAPAGIVGWWPAEGNANDIVGTNNGTANVGVGYAAGEVGQAFSFNGTSSYVQVPDAPALHLTNQLTIEFWVRRQQLTDDYIVNKGGDWTRGALNYGVAIAGPSNGNVLTFLYANGLRGTISITDFNWHHCAVTARNGDADPTFYVDGVQQPILLRKGPATMDLYPSTAPLYIGAQLDPIANYFSGAEVDELSLYSRALSSNEVAAIYNAGSTGKCPPAPMPPAIGSQPANQTVIVGQTATFSVSASGTTPLSYQWQLGGTNILNATNSLLTLTNVQLSQAGDYSVQISNTLGSTNSAPAMLTVVLPPVITTQPQSQSVSSFQTASFTVAAAGTGPLSYQWRKNGTNLTDGVNISGSLTTNLNLAAVTLADAGNYDVVVSSPYAGTNSAVAVLTVPQTALTIGSASAMSGSTLTVPITMNALGVENTFLASVGYDNSKLVLQSVQLGQGTAGAYLQEVDTHTNNGLVGFAISLNTGEVIPAGTQQVAQLVFYTLPVTNNVNTSLTFGDNPTTRQILDNAFDLLPATYLGGTISLSPAEYEADVYPRPTGDHQVTVQDWLEVGRMVAGLDVVTNSDEMLRADCAPRNAPDGVLTVADWVQAGRYALGLDPLTLVPPPVISNLKFTAHGSPAPTRTVQLGTVSAQRDQTVSVPVLLISSTNENAVGLTVNYNPSQLKYLSATLGSALSGGRLNINTNFGAGKLGLALALSPGAALAAGTNQIAVLQFQTTTNAVGNVPLTLDSSVVQLQVADKTAVALTANYVNGAVVLPLSPTVQAVKTGNNLQLAWPISAGSYLVQYASSLAGPWSNAPITIVTNGAYATITMQATNQQQFFRLLGQ